MKLYSSRNGSEPLLLGDVSSFAEADALVESLQEQWEAWEAAGYPEAADPRITQLEGAEIHAVDGTGTVWLENGGAWAKEGE